MRARSFWERLRLALRPPRTLKVTRAGKVFLAVSLGVGVAALNTGNNLLYLLLGLQLSAIVASGILSERCLRGLKARRLGADAAFAGEPFAFRWALYREKGPAFALRVEETGAPLSGESGRLLHLPPGEERSVRASLVAKARGPIWLQGIRVTTAYPLGLFEKTRTYDAEELFVVYPRRVAAPLEDESGRTSPLGERADPRRGGGDGDLLGVREIADGEEARRVHWKKSASIGKLVRAEREREDRRAYLFELPEGSPEALTPVVERLAALSQKLVAEGAEVGLTSKYERLPPASGVAQERRILRALGLAGFPEAETAR